MKKTPLPLPDDEIEIISKSEQKREALRLHALGKTLSELPKGKLEELPVSDNLRAALAENARLTQHEAKRRHLQYIGKLMRDEDIEAITAKLELLDPASEVFGRIIKQSEMWRNRLVEQDDGLNAFIETYPDIDRQALRNLIRNAQKELASEPPRPGSNYKKLFQLIKDTISG